MSIFPPLSGYLVKEMFGPTIQGEGCHAGMPCVFLRFAVCNLECSWCDTDFAAAGAERLDAAAIVARLLELDRGGSRRVVVTGGEPTLQWDETLATSLRDAGFRVHMESNGTRPLAAPVDWLTVSPKPRFHDGRFRLDEAAAVRANECKVVVDGSVGGRELERYETLYPCGNWFVQPCDDDRKAENLGQAIALVTANPRWRLSLQLHKLVGLP